MHSDSMYAMNVETNSKYGIYVTIFIFCIILVAVIYAAFKKDHLETHKSEIKHWRTHERI